MIYENLYQEGCVGDYLTSEQKDGLRLSQSSDLIKCKIPKKIDEWNEKFENTTKNIKDKVKQTICNGLINVSSYNRLGHDVHAYTRSCGRH